MNIDKLKGLRSISSTAKLMRPMRVSSECEFATFSELAQLSQEKGRLNGEKENWQERLKRIDARLGEIAELEESLRRQMAIAVDMSMTQDARWIAGEGREVIVKY